MQQTGTNGFPLLNLPKLNQSEQELIEQLISGLHYPETLIEKVVVGEKFVAVKTSDKLGLTSTLGAKPTSKDTAQIEVLKGEKLKQAAKLLFDDSFFPLSIGLAALNAGFESPPYKTGIGADEIILEHGREKEVALVGNFPFVGRLRKEVKRLHLLELRDVPEAVPYEQWEEALHKSNVVALTSTALLTRSMAYFLRHTKHALVIVIGPSTPLTSVLFNWGVYVLAGSIIVDQKQVMEGVQMGMCYRELKKKGIEPIVCVNSNAYQK